MKTFPYNSSRRNPSDTFTRFTSTTPHATTFNYQPSSQAGRNRPPPNFASPQSPAPASSQQPYPPPNETPLEKVARLRAAHRATVAAQETSAFDRFLASGRNVADRAHRLTAYGLILFSGLAVCVTAYGTVSLITHSRRQKRAWVERELDRLDGARKAFLSGTANAEQLHLLEQERAGTEMQTAKMREAERKKAEGVWGRLKGMVGGTMAQGEMGEETPQERERRLTHKQRGGEEGWIEGEVQPVAPAPVPGSVVKEVVRVTPTDIPGVGIDSKGRPVPAGRVEYVSRIVEENPKTGEKRAVVRVGGPLDIMASNAVDSASTGQGWRSWIRGDASGKP